MAVETIQVPDLGDAADVEVIEVLVNAGDSINENDSIVVLETDKAAMEIPAPKSGTIKEMLVKVGDKVSMGDALLSMESAGDAEANSAPVEEVSEAKVEEKAEEKVEEAQAPEQKASAMATMEVAIPDLGDAGEVEVIDILVAVGDEVEVESGLVTLETDKAAMDVPSPAAGKITAVKVKVGDKVSEGTLIVDLETTSEVSAPVKNEPSKNEGVEEESTASTPKPSAPAASVPTPSTTSAVQTSVSNEEVYAGPAVRKLARELGVDLTQVKGTGTRNRIIKEDVHGFVKSRLQGGAAASVGGSGIPGIPDIDFSKFGEVEEVEMTKLHQVTAQNMTKCWLNVPHVTQFDKCDVTDLEDFRAAQKGLAEKKGIKLTPMPFIIKACALALKEHPQFNVSLHSSGTKLIKKSYCHIGVAVATPAGLMVPVIKDADKKSIWEIGAELSELGALAKDRRLTREQMEGSCFTVSSLGAIGGTGFTPIVASPEVAILGVSKTSVEPVYVNGEFVPRKMMPYSLSYDHRAVNGLDGGLFCTYLGTLLSDIRLMAL